MPEGPPIREVVDLTELAEERFSKKHVYSGSFLQRAGVKLFYWVLAATCGVIGLAFLYLVVEILRLPPSPFDGIPGNPVVSDSLAGRAVSNTRSAVFSNFKETIELLVIGVFFPLLTAILGYLFGTGEANRESNDA